MIGGSGNRLAKIARTKSSPDIDAITSMGTTPYSMALLAGFIVHDLSTHHVIPDLIRTFMTVQRGLPGQVRHPAAVNNARYKLATLSPEANPVT